MIEPAIFELTRIWLDSCTEHHKLCTPKDTPKLPPRILDVISRDDPFLLETNNEYGDYIALSYCWGKERRPDMMLFGPKSKGKRGQPDPTPNIEVHKTRISFSSMPKTLQDAVTFCRYLRVRYLWIDALCIVQGDDEEWAKEHHNLADTYTNARLVLAADTADGLEKGFLEHNMSMARNKDTNLDSNTELTQKEHFSPSHSKAPPCPSPLSLNEPLNNRAWSLSEVIFSTRVIHFTSSSIIWECNSVRHCTLGCSLTFSDDESENDDTSSFRFFRCADIAQRYTKAELYRRWDRLVEHFTRRQINSHPDDTYKDAQRLVALSRLAKRFAGILRDVHACDNEYLAGIWSGNLATSLLWSVEKGLERYPAVTWRRPGLTRAPSWSWAAVEGPVFLDTLREFQTNVKIREASVTLCDDNDLFGQVREGKLVVQGKVVHKLRMSRGDRTGHVCNISGSGFDGEWSFIADVPVCDEDLREEFSCLFIGEAKKTDAGRISACCIMLLLRPVRNIGQTFERVGISSRSVECGVSTLLDTLIEEVVVII
jgi:hypothetical protein